jgi:hypothetical protein
MKSLPGVEFVTASDAARLYADAAQKHAFSRQELAAIAGQVGPDVSFQVDENRSLAASDVFYLLTEFVAQIVARKSLDSILLNGTPAGPISPFDGTAGATPAGGAASGELQQPLDVPWSQFSRTVLDVADSLEKNQQVPNVVWFGSQPAPPESYLAALAPVARTLLAANAPPASVTVAPARLAAARYVAEDSPALWSWVIFPEGFHSAHLMNLARLQAWTLKPALLHR